jgi:hypothetical protein
MAGFGFGPQLGVGGKVNTMDKKKKIKAKPSKDTFLLRLLGSGKAKAAGKAISERKAKLEAALKD